ncbi:DUF6862 domain-containing protein, partial [Xylophilus ampelinus]|nr:hypothetical protein [Xylophilus ampelinus]
IAGTSVGAAVGGGAGAAAAGNATVNNYLSHVRPNPMRLSEAERYEAAVAACGRGDAAACDTRNALAQTSAQRDRDLAQACSGATPDACAVRAGEATAMGNTVRTTEGGYVYATSPTLTQLNPPTIGNPKRPDSLHDTLAQSTADGILVEAGNQAIVAVVAPLVKGASAVVGMVKGPVGDLAPSTATTTGIAATDGTATSAYGSGGRTYGSTTVTDAGGNVVPTQPTLPGAAGRGAGATDAADLGVGGNGGVVADEAAALGRIGGKANGPALTGKAPNTVLNQQAVNDLANGSLPGITKNPKTGLPDAVPRTGVPREMPASSNPSATAEDFANRLFGENSTPAIAKPIPNCSGCWSATNAEGISVTYRPASTASVDTAATTASVDINFKSNENVINGGKPVKLKFPQAGG